MAAEVQLFHAQTGTIMIKRFIIIFLLSLTVTTTVWAVDDQQPVTVKKERNHIRAGNKLFHNKRYAEAEVEYRKALQVAPQSAIAQFNLATTLLKQGGGAASQDDKNNPVNQAAGILADLAQHAPNKSLRSKANYDLGNLAYASQDYGKAVELYKQALREDPADDQARYNLRLAQLKLKQQQQQQQNKDKNQDKDKDKKDQDKKDQDKKDQDKKDQDKKDQDKQNQDQQKQQPQQQQQQGGMSQQNAEQVLKTMQNQENATQQRINAERAQQERRERARTNRKW
jgi:hypothetical protein